MMTSPTTPYIGLQFFFYLPSSIRFSYQESLEFFLFSSFFLPWFFITTCPGQGFLMTRLPTSVLTYPSPVPPMLIVLFLCLETRSAQSTLPLLLSVSILMLVRCHMAGTVIGTGDTKKNKAELLPLKRSPYFGG